MKKTLVSLYAVILIALLIGCGTAQTTTTVTIPTTVDTETFIEINTVADLQAIMMNKSYRLMQDLDLEGAEWTPLGTFEEPFLGIFDGNNHVISNMTITVRNTSFNGLFAHVSGSVSNLEIRDFSIAYTAQFITYAGGLAGYLSGDVDGVEINGSITIANNASNTYAGLLAGASVAKVTASMTAEQFVANAITDTNVAGTINITGKNFVYVGGLAGKIHNTIVDEAKVDADITASAQNYRIYAGGVVGHHYGGLLVGYEGLVDDSEIPLTNIYARTDLNITVSGIQASVGGFAGFSQYGVYENVVTIADIQLGGTKLYAGLLLGEAWNGDYRNLLASGSLTVMTQAEQILLIDSLLGFANLETTLTNSFYRVSTGETLTNAHGLQATQTQLVDPEWYQEWLEWDETFETFADLAAYFAD